MKICKQNLEKIFFFSLGRKYFYILQSDNCNYVYVNVFSKVYPACHNIANGIKPGNNSKTTDKHAAEC